ncbi:helix-hairpin-helix domain-containing protein [candidate division KSB1 bacterium]|nr:helix-hairpin-helix domain-containing protein [candidate division KSB1 bacterium]
MRGFTRQEQRAILLLLSAFGIGSLMWLYRQSRPLPPVNPAEVAAFEEYARALERDTSGVVAPTEALDSKARPVASTLSQLDLNMAVEADLVRLPGIGPVMAKRIVEYRQAHGPFKRLDDLRQVKGIGAKTYAKLAPLLVVK